MEEDLPETTKKVESMGIESLKLYKSRKVNNKVDGEVLFIFKLLDFEQTGQPGQLNDKICCHPPKYTLLSLESSCFSNLDNNEFMKTVNEVTSMADLFFYPETNEELALDLTRLIRSYYRFSVDVLRKSSDYSLVFVVDVWRRYASKGFIEAKERILLANSTSRRESIADDDEEKVEHVFVDAYVDDGDGLDDMCCEESSMTDEMDKDDADDDCDYRGVIIMDDDTWGKEDSVKKDAMKDIHMINMVTSWQEYPNDSASTLEEIEPLITYQELVWDVIANDQVITKEAEKYGECAICLKPFTGKIGHDPFFIWYQEANALELVTLSCGHSFHHSCIFKWLGKSPTCPLCRSVSYVIV